MFLDLENIYAVLPSPRCVPYVLEYLSALFRPLSHVLPPYIHLNEALDLVLQALGRSFTYVSDAVIELSHRTHQPKSSIPIIITIFPSDGETPQAQISQLLL
jgi:hypothetical protein